ncbi:PHOsphatase [Thoreauomyces humboldtii]|nr:PHOsphatase [Thoreauomyces humboldtii]
MAGMITTQGERDMIQLAERFKIRYPTLLSNASRLSWQATNISRALTSGEAFQRGLLSSASDLEAAVDQIRASVVMKNRDADLRPHTSCKRYLEAIKEKEKGSQADQEFMESQFPAIRDRVAERGGFGNLTSKHVMQMFSICAFEEAIQGNRMGFCSLFTPDELVLSDFGSDLKFWSYRGYGFLPNENLACSLLTTLWTNLSSFLANPSSTPTGIFKFAHAETIAPLLTTLGLFRDPPPGLHPNMTNREMSSRVYKTSASVPFAGNVVFELLECDGRHVVRVLSNERVVVIPGCGSENPHPGLTLTAIDDTPKVPGARMILTPF